MKLVQIIVFILSGLGLFSCQSTTRQQAVYELVTADVFHQQLQQNPSAQVLDVRTPEEYAAGYLPQAINIDYNSDDFETQLTKLDKSKFVFVYCLSGGRSASAVTKMQEAGFQKIYALDKGLMAWRQANLPLETSEKQAETTETGMTLEEFSRQVTRDKLVLVDYNATWCGPCKKMLPVLQKLEETHKDKLVLFPVDADKNPELISTRQIQGIPHLELYQQGKLVWTYTGFVTEEDLLTSIQPHL